jgi:DNA-binding transcriptional MocR family regulator
MVALLPSHHAEEEVVANCRKAGLAVSPLKAYYAGPARLSGLVLGFAGTPVALAADCARRLEAAVSAGH